MIIAAYKVEKSRRKGLWLLTETMTFEDGRKGEGFRAYFESRDAAIFHARTMMGHDEDTLSDETGILERGSRKKESA